MFGKAQYIVDKIKKIIEEAKGNDSSIKFDLNDRAIHVVWVDITSFLDVVVAIRNKEVRINLVDISENENVVLFSAVPDIIKRISVLNVDTLEKKVVYEKAVI